MSRLLRDIGTIEWARRTNGILGRGERARFMAATVLASARLLPSLLVGHRTSPGSAIDPTLLTPPDTPFARNVVEVCADLDPMVIEHSYRSYIFGRALGTAEGIECDPEALFAATMLHDYALETADSLTDRCFTVAGVEVAEQVLESSPLDSSLRHDVLDAITLHLNPRVPPEHGAVQHLAHDGIMLDVLGARRNQLDPAGIRRTFDQHPRHGFTVRGTPLLREHGRRVPGCRVNALLKLGFGRALRTSPWSHLDQTTTIATADAA
jgi:hypothetical protein